MNEGRKERDEKEELRRGEKERWYSCIDIKRRKERMS